MNPAVPLAFLQLKKQPRRLLIAIAGIAMSSLGILGQMGFEDSLFRSATRLFEEFDGDIALLSPQYQFMVLPATFTERRLYQALAVPGVESFSSVRLGVAPFKNPLNGVNRNVYVVGVSGEGPVFANAAWESQLSLLTHPDAALFDSRSRPEFGPIGKLFHDAPLHTEIANRRTRIAGLFEMGASFSADGTVITSADGFARIFPERRARMVDLGFLHIAPDANVSTVVARLRAALPRDVTVMTHEQLNRQEQIYWRGTTPAGFIFKTVLFISLVVGCVSVYQILSSDIAENLPQYATLTAIGYPHRYFIRTTLEKAWLLTSVAYPIGFLLAAVVYLSATHFTLVPLVMTSARALGVYVIVLAAACAAGLLAIDRLRRSDLSELL